MDGEVYFDETGDPLLDKWEEELAKGIMPDLEEGLSHSSKQQLKKEREAYIASNRQSAGFEDIDDDYSRTIKSFDARKGRSAVLGAGAGTKKEADVPWEDLLGTD